MKAWEELLQYLKSVKPNIAPYEEMQLMPNIQIPIMFFLLWQRA